MSDKKTLNIDPNVFSFTNNKSTRKRTKQTNSNGIKIKQNAPKKKDDSLKKRSILKMIRQHQSDRYNKLFNPEPIKQSKPVDDGSQFKNEFKEAQQFFQNLTEKTEQKTKIQNHTLKQYPCLPERSLLMHPSIPPITENIFIPPIQNGEEPFKIKPSTAPVYGCLKNGTLPTYRNYMNVTQKNTAPIHLPKIKELDVAAKLESVKAEIMEQKINDSMNRIHEIKQTTEKLQQLKMGGQPKKLKQKKTIRRTYKIGKSKVLPKVSVLVSNRTLRNNISTQSQSLKQIPIDEVKKYLMKRGFIKVGSTSPNDVLRKMYESAVLICGEVQNHNPDNLLYNFLNNNE
jgi:hypothetical protein